MNLNPESWLIKMPEHFKYEGEIARDMDKAEIEGIEYGLLCLSALYNTPGRDAFHHDDIMGVMDELIDRRNLIRQAWGEDEQQS